MLKNRVKGKYFLPLILILSIQCAPPPAKTHECRLWGIIFDQDTTVVNEIIRTHLESLRALGAANPDGWGMGYYVRSETDTLLPVIRRGEPSAPLDPRYPDMAQELIRNLENSAIAHVRRGSSGPTSGIPDPHPFRRKCLNRKFDILFAHNGTISTDVLLKLIQLINPSYLEQNPPDYNPNYLDSDLYSILLVEIMDEYPDLTIEECIKMAVVMIDSALVVSKAQLNFVMSSGNTLWALNFTRDAPKAITLYLSPDLPVSDYWVVASQPLDTLHQNWVEIPNFTLVCLRPNEPARFMPIYQKFDVPGKDIVRNFVVRPNPINGSARLDYYIDIPGVVSIDVYDGSGRHVKNLLKEFKLTGSYSLVWDGCGDDRNILPFGIYFIHIKNESQETTLKVINFPR